MKKFLSTLMMFGFVCFQSDNLGKVCINPDNVAYIAVCTLTFNKVIKGSTCVYFNAANKWGTPHIRVKGTIENISKQLSKQRSFLESPQ